MISETVREIQIGLRAIGPRRPVYLIAEAGVNHNGSVDAALQLVDAAREAGADAVKFQAFKATRLASRHAEQAAYQKGSAKAPSQVEMLARLELSPAEFAHIRQHCDQVGIEFLATPFGLEDVQILLDLGVRAIKIASPDIVNKPLLEAAARSNLPVLLSTGASELPEIDRAHDFLTRQYRCGLVLLHCVSHYPTQLGQANLARITALSRRFGGPAGYSDHTQEISAAGLAVAAGACVLEKHFTLDRTQSGPDHAFSLSPAELADYVKQARQAGPAPHHPAMTADDEAVFVLADIEREVRRVSRCSVTAACDIPAGATLTRDMLVAKRPGTGISAWDIDTIPGRCATQLIPADTPITSKMLA